MTAVEVETTADHPDSIDHHWIMTVQSGDGRQGTNDGVIGAIPGMHTRQSTYNAVRKAMADWMGTDNITVVFFTVAPNQL
jgi:hypothetical protein